MHVGGLVGEGGGELEERGKGRGGEGERDVHNMIILGV